MIKSIIIKPLRKLLRYLGIDIVRYNPVTFKTIYPDFDTDSVEIIQRVKDLTMTSPEMIFALCEAVRYINSHNIPSDIVECGVWKGGSMMAVAHMLLKLNDVNRNLYLFDTFEGMPPPSDIDVNLEGFSAETLLRDSKKDEKIWAYAPLESVRQAISATNYDPKKIYFIQGMVEETIPNQAPENISILRLDTDWYESTRHELIHLFPRLVKGGIIIIDDYGYWQGARKAVDEYFIENKIGLFLTRADFAGRIGVKIS